MAYDPVDPDTLIPGAKIIASLALKTRDNPLAVAAGDMSVPIPNTIDLGKALRTAETNPTNVIKASAGGLITWGAAPSIQVQQRATVGGGTWVVPAGVTQVEVQAWGGGGGGYEGRFFPTFEYPRCGPSGSHARGVILVTPGETLTWQVGGGGGGGTGGNQPGGGGSTFLRNAGNTSHATAGAGDAAGAVGVASAAGVYVAALLLDGAPNPIAATSGFRAIAPLSHNLYGSGGGTGQAGGQGYLRWRYVQP